MTTTKTTTALALLTVANLDSSDRSQETIVSVRRAAERLGFALPSSMMSATVYRSYCQRLRRHARRHWGL